MNRSVSTLYIFWIQNKTSGQIHFDWILKNFHILLRESEGERAQMCVP